MTDTIIVPDSTTDVVESQDRMWDCVVIDDPVNLISYVRAVLVRDLGLDDTKATQVTMEVHTRGRSVAKSGGRAEMYAAVVKLQSRGLTAKLEQQL